MNTALLIHPDNISIEYLTYAQKLNVEISFILVMTDSSQKMRETIRKRTNGKYVFKDVYKLLADANLPCYFIHSINSKNAIKLLKSTDLLIAGGREIIGAEAIAAPRIGILNSHPSDISKYRGCGNVERAILNKDDYIYVSCHFITSSVDSGPLVYQDRLDYKGMDYHLT